MATAGRTEIKETATMVTGIKETATLATATLVVTAAAESFLPVLLKPHRHLLRPLFRLLIRLSRPEQAAATRVPKGLQILLLILPRVSWMKALLHSS
ncbi:hypothetical protein D3C73_1532890 [compost metagenome]